MVKDLSKHRTRLVQRVSSKTFYKKLISRLFIYILLICLSFTILYPFIAKLAISFMSETDAIDPMVQFLPRDPTLDNFKMVIKETKWFSALLNTTVLSLISGLLQVFVSALVGYGLAKFPFRGNKVIFCIVVFTMIIPPMATRTATYLNFAYFDLYGLIPSIRMLDSMVPVIYMSATGLALKNGLYIFIMRQYFKSVPNELLEAAEVDGAGVFRTYFRIVMPMAANMMLTIFLLSFAWQWTDVFYSPLFFPQFNVLANTVSKVTVITASGVGAGSNLASILVNTATVMLIVPLLLLYLVAQRYFIQGIERSGLVG